MNKRICIKGLLLSLGLVLAGVLTSLAWAQHYPTAPQGYVTDEAEVMNPQDKSALENLARELEDKTTDQAAIVTVATVQPETIEGYAVNLFKRWGIGQKGKDNGVLLLVAVNDHKVRIETGYGLEAVLPDVLCDKIIRTVMVPAFKAGQFSQGIKDGAAAMMALIARDRKISLTGQDGQELEPLASGSRASVSEDFELSIGYVFKILNELWNLFSFIIFFIIAFGLLVFPKKFSFLGTGVGSYRGGGGFSGGGGGFSGGFGGFGGGGSGGGGASGGW